MKCCQKFETCESVRILYEFQGNNVTEEQNFVKKTLDQVNPSTSV